MQLKPRRRLLFGGLASLVVIIVSSACTESFEIDHNRLHVLRWDGKSLFIGQPTVRPNPIERAPLVAIIEFESPVEVEAVLEIDDGQRNWEQRIDEAKREHRIAVMGMRPDRKHEIRVRVENLDGSKTDISDKLLFFTPPLPESFPPLQTTIAKPEAMEPGLTMFAVNLWHDDVSMLDYGFIVILDAEGEVVWYCQTQDRIADMRVLKNGHLLYQHGSYRYAYEIDILGRDIRSWYGANLTHAPNEDAIPVEVDTMHHDIVELANGNFMTLATEVRKFAAFPSSEFDADAPKEPAHVVCDDLVEFKPETGEIVSRMHLTDLLDKSLFGYLSLGSFWKDKYNDRLGAVTRDWSHANAIVNLPEENAVLISFRHLDCLIKIDREKERIVWILGDPSGWGEAWQPLLLKPVGDLQWSYHHHGPQITPRGTIMMYDNGNYRSRPFDRPVMAPQNQSRIVEYRVDETNMTVEQVYEYSGTDGEHFYCPFYCEGDWLPKTKNVLVTDGGHIELEDGTPSDDVPSDRQWARIFEISRGDSPEKVFEVVCQSPLGSPYGWSIYRANRIPNFQDVFKIDPPSVDENVELFERGRISKTLKDRD